MSFNKKKNSVKPDFETLSVNEMYIVYKEYNLLHLNRDFQNEAVKGISEAVDLRESMATPTLSNGRLPPSAASSDQLSVEFEITTVDDDILNTVEKLFNFGKSGAIPYDTIQEILGKLRSMFDKRIIQIRENLENKYSFVYQNSALRELRTEKCVIQFAPDNDVDMSDVRYM